MAPAGYDRFDDATSTKCAYVTNTSNEPVEIEFPLDAKNKKRAMNAIDEKAMGRPIVRTARVRPFIKTKTRRRG